STSPLVYTPPRFTITFPIAINSFFLHAPPTTQFDALSLHDALPISDRRVHRALRPRRPVVGDVRHRARLLADVSLRFHCGGLSRSEEHTSELQSHLNLVCRLLLEKKKNT